MNLTDLYAIRHGAVQPTEHPLSRKDEHPSIVDRGEGVQLSLPVHSAEIGCVDWYIYPDPAPKGKEPRASVGTWPRRGAKHGST